MWFKSRFRLRTLLILVGLVGLEFGLATELQNRRGRDSNLTAARKHRQQAAWHRDQAELCRQSLSSGRSFSIRDRNTVHRRAARSLDIPMAPLPLNNWSAELTYHGDRLEWHSNEAAEAARKQEHYQRRLLWPF